MHKKVGNKSNSNNRGAVIEARDKGQDELVDKRLIDTGKDRIKNEMSKITMHNLSKEISVQNNEISANKIDKIKLEAVINE